MKLVQGQIDRIRDNSSPEKIALRAQLNLLDIRQQSFKITGNSIYGCLGSPFCRFYSKTLAELVTYYGRKLLAKVAKEIPKFNCDVIYGDTDSVFVHTRTKDIEIAMTLGRQIQKRVNSFSKSGLLEIGIDAVYQRLLLNEKKQYAGISVVNAEEYVLNMGIVDLQKKLLVKGMEVVRREWCKLTKFIGTITLNLVLSDDSAFVEKVYKLVEKISDLLYSDNLNAKTLKPELEKEQKYENYENFMQLKTLSLSFLKMHMMLNKSLSEYDVNTLAFVNVARRFQAAKKLKDIQMINKVIPYVICVGEPGQKYFDRAYHPEEYYQSTAVQGNGLKLDGLYYLDSQIFKPLNRILSNIKEVDIRRVGQLLNLEDKTVQRVVIDREKEEIKLGKMQRELNEDIGGEEGDKLDEKIEENGKSGKDPIFDEKKKNQYIYTRFNDIYKKFELKWTENVDFLNTNNSKMANLTNLDTQENDINNSNLGNSQTNLDEDKNLRQDTEIKRKLILNYTTSTSKEFLAMNKQKISTQMIRQTADIAKNYYANSDLVCLFCGHVHTGNVLVIPDSCVKCKKGRLAPATTPNEVNGNLDYLQEITEAVVRKNSVSANSLSRHIDQTVAKYIQSVVKMSSYERVDMEEHVYSNVKGLSIISETKHYSTLNCFGKSVQLGDWEEAIHKSILQRNNNEDEETFLDY